MSVDRTRHLFVAWIAVASMAAVPGGAWPDEEPAGSAEAPARGGREGRRGARTKEAPKGEAMRARAGLGALVPAGVNFYARTRMTPERARLVEPYLEALRKLCASGIDKDLFDLLTLELPEHRRDEAAAVVSKVKEIVTTPRWGELFRREFAVAYRFSFPIPEYLYLFRSGEDSAGERRAELRRFLEGIASFAPETLQVKDSSKLGAEVSSLEAPGVPIGLHVASRRGIVAIATSESFLERALELGESGDLSGSIARDERFRTALAGLEGRTESQIYFDFSGYVKFFTGLLAMVPVPPEEESHQRAVLGVARDVLDELARLGPLASVDRTAEDRLVRRMRIGFVQDGDRAGFLEGLVRDQKPLEEVLRVVPKDAAGFYFTAGVDPSRIYDAIVGLVRKHVPDADRALEEWSRLQDRIGFHLRDDLLSLLDGGFGCVSLLGRPGGWSKECVLIVRLRDADRAASALEGAYRRAKRFLENRGQSFEAVPLPQPLESLHELRIGAFPWLRPVVGTAGDVMVIASSEDAVERLARTFTGESPNFLEAEACARLELPEGPLTEVYYGDMKHSLRGLADLASGVGFVASILPKNEETRGPRKLGAILTKLGAFIREIDLAGEYGGWSRYDPDAHAIFARTFSQVRRAAD
ncbi:MAG: hypothetical protein ACUVYA_03910 [Planctomycetota bacterium]